MSSMNELRMLLVNIVGSKEHCQSAVQALSQTVTEIGAKEGLDLTAEEAEELATNLLVPELMKTLSPNQLPTRFEVG